jgi:hypothetical protein
LWWCCRTGGSFLGPAGTVGGRSWVKAAELPVGSGAAATAITFTMLELTFFFFN